MNVRSPVALSQRKSITDRRISWDQLINFYFRRWWFPTLTTNSMETLIWKPLFFAQTVQPRKPQPSSGSVWMQRISTPGSDINYFGPVQENPAIYILGCLPSLRQKKQLLRFGRELWNHLVQPAHFIDKKPIPDRPTWEIEKDFEMTSSNQLPLQIRKPIPIHTGRPHRKYTADLGRNLCLSILLQRWHDHPQAPVLEYWPCIEESHLLTYSSTTMIFEQELRIHSITAFY